MAKKPRRKRFRHFKRHTPEMKRIIAERNDSKSKPFNSHPLSKIDKTDTKGVVHEGLHVLPKRHCLSGDESLLLGKNQEDCDVQRQLVSGCSSVAHSTLFTSTSEGLICSVQSLENSDDSLPYIDTKLNSEEQGKSMSSIATEPDSSVNLVDLLKVAEEKVKQFLFPRWMTVVRDGALHVVLTSPHSNFTIQRNIVFCPSGKVQLFVHCKPVCMDEIMNHIFEAVSLQSDTIDEFVDRCVSVVSKVRALEICSGYDDEKWKAGWSTCILGEVDKNMFKECRYEETFRSYTCKILINSRKWRCDECNKLYAPLKRRTVSATNPDPAANTGNIFLTSEQKLKKLQDRKRKLDNASKKISRLRDRMQDLLKKQGVKIDESLSTDLMGILNDSTISPAQSIFVQQQIKASQQKKMVGMRWHPTMIRLAISLHLISPAAYEMLRDTGMVKLPSSRTLFDYSHVKATNVGIDTVVLDDLSQRVGAFKESHKKFHILMADEMHISQNLIFQKVSGKLVGYISLEDFDDEVHVLEKYLDNGDLQPEPVIASKVLLYMIKGVSNGVKGVVATYPVGNMSVSQMYMWTWEVIGALEASGVKIVAFVCDGSSTNRAFIKKHKCVTSVNGGIIYDTINKAAPDRILYFISDVPHLLKTIRNCLLNSRSDNKKSRRRMRRNGKNISWDYIIKLYESKKYKNLRKAYKLSPMNVYPDSYARMKVKYAAEVLSLTVAQCLEDEGWQEAEELIFFIRQVNNWFDCLNGAHSSMGDRRRNSNLNPYTSVEDDRFRLLMSFLDYLHEWREQAQIGNSTLNATNASCISENQTTNVNNSLDSIINTEEGDDCAENETKADKKILSNQTLVGIEISTRAIIDLIKYLLDIGTPFINARIFCQDPLEQHFSKVRAGQGGSNNPNFNQVLKKNRATHTAGEMGMKRRKGNSGEDISTVVVTEEPLPKRKRNRHPKFTTEFMI